MTAKELDELLSVCRKHGVTVFTDGKIRIAFDAQGQHVPMPQEMRPVPKTMRRMSDTERFLFAATEGFIEEDEQAVVEKETS